MKDGKVSYRGPNKVAILTVIVKMSQVSWSINLYSFAVSYSFATLKMIRDPCPNVFLIECP